MQIMHNCPHCGGTMGIEASRLAAAHSYHCAYCEKAVRPTPELRRTAQRLIAVRDRIDEEFALRYQEDAEGSAAEDTFS